MALWGPSTFGASSVITADASLYPSNSGVFGISTSIRPISPSAGGTDAPSSGGAASGAVALPPEVTLSASGPVGRFSGGAPPPDSIGGTPAPSPAAGPSPNGSVIVYL